MTEPPSPAGDSVPELAPEWRRGFDWIEATLGGRIVAARRQARWRPAWFLDLERDGERVPLYFRGQRVEVENGFAALEFEAGLLRKLEAEGIPVPHVHALCPEPGGIVMDRSPGRANLATADDDAQRTGVLADYMDVLARLHALDSAGFDGLGLRVSRTDEELGLGDFHSWIERFRRAKARPEPEVEFLLGWVLRNVPKGRTRRSFVCADSGQFLFEGHRVTALIDLELAYVGDPAADLGALRCRDLSEPLGPIAPAIRRYERNVGEAIDPAVIDYHTVRFATCTPLAVAPMVSRVIPGLDHAQYLTWCHVYSKTPLEVIAERMGVTLETLAPPEPAETRYSASFDTLVGMLGHSDDPAPEDEEAGEFAAYERDSALRMAQVLARVDRLGPVVESGNLDDVASLLGERPSDPHDADARLEAYVREAPTEADAELVPLLQRRLQRQAWLVEPALREYAGARIQRID